MNPFPSFGSKYQLEPLAADRRSCSRGVRELRHGHGLDQQSAIITLSMRKQQLLPAAMALRQGHAWARSLRRVQLPATPFVGLDAAEGAQQLAAARERQLKRQPPQQPAAVASCCDEALTLQGASHPRRTW